MKRGNGHEHILMNGRVEHYGILSSHKIERNALLFVDHFAKRELLGRGAYSPHSQITARIWSFDPEEHISPEFFRGRLQRAIGFRGSMLKEGPPQACRLVNAESDHLPGVIVDRYGDCLVCQFLSAEAEFWNQDILEELKKNNTRCQHL